MLHGIHENPRPDQVHFLMNDQVRILDARGNPITADTAHFAASRRARELQRWAPTNASADAVLLDESDTIAARAYDLERNHAVVAGGIRTGVDNIVGSGLRLSARPDYRALGRTKEWADEWSMCADCGKAFRTSPNSYGWTPSYVLLGECDLVCRKPLISTVVRHARGGAH